MAKNKNPVLPTLYSKNADGSINEWAISVEARERPIGIYVGAIVTKFGRVGGAIQTTLDIVAEGKNIGKKNETTPLEQAQKEAKAKWTKQKKKGYVESIEDAQADKVDAIIEGGVEPMLAQKYRDHAKKIVWPAVCQPKLDGIRCIAIVNNGKCTLWSRTRKQITGVPHIAIHLERLFAGKSIVLDGELYNHDMKNDFEKIVSFVRQVTPQAGHEVVQYHVYDVVAPGSFVKRTEATSAIPANHAKIKLVKSPICQNPAEMEEFFAECLEEGYEGCMVRNMDSLYENKRSYGLQKVKEFEDAEFEIVGVEEGRGKMAGKAIFVCKTAKGDEFNCKMKGSLDSLRKYVQRPGLAIGKKLTVRYQGFTNGNVPRFPVGIIVRDYE